ncbi:hypothetical protein DPMN_149091 [Dreissena polymorpha]|uniref:WAP domain-containing protein n=1 Tax=Dreissena polymorpha TaxID=45954 RepID=A0A9D4FF95_DREPO|nr:hypothetical protein DPMN_149091 [Dreissena polymorpha]
MSKIVTFDKDASAAAIVSEKPGKCPTVGISPATCAWECKSDNECPYREICCPTYNCRGVCVAPTRMCLKCHLQNDRLLYIYWSKTHMCVIKCLY